MHAKHHPAVAPTNSFACARCAAVKRSSKYSCCVRGGSWFKSCGNNGDFDHTWAEGLQACKNVASLLSVKTESQPMQLNLTTTSQEQHVVQDEASDSSVASAHDTPTPNSKGHDHLSWIIVLVKLISLILRINR